MSINYRFIFIHFIDFEIFIFILFSFTQNIFFLFYFFLMTEKPNSYIFSFIIDGRPSNDSCFRKLILPEKLLHVFIIHYVFFLDGYIFSLCITYFSSLIFRGRRENERNWEMFDSFGYCAFVTSTRRFYGY